MRTTIDIDPQLLAEAEEILGETSPSKTVNAALAEVVRKRKLQELSKMLGTSELDYDWLREEETEVKSMMHYER